MTTQEVRIQINPTINLDGILTIPDNAKAIVLFAHGSGSSRFSTRNTYVATVLQQRGIGTLLFDLLTQEEDKTYAQRFDIALLADRLELATDWLRKQPACKNLKLGYFGASTGSASALFAAARYRTEIFAVVSRGGRPDLAQPVLRDVICPTLLIVGGNDTQVIELNEMAYELLACEKKLYIVRGATHLFEEPGTLEEAARVAADWFIAWL